MFDFFYFSLVIGLAYISTVLFNLNLLSDGVSEYELKRRARDGDRSAKKRAWVKKHEQEVGLSLKLLFLLAQGLFIVLLSLRSANLWLPVVVYVFVFCLMRFVLVKNFTPKMFSFWETSLINSMQDIVGLFKAVLKPIFRRPVNFQPVSGKAFHSEDEFAYRFNLDSGSLSELTRKKIERILKGTKTKAKDVMLEVDSIPKVDVNLSLTPVIYDELHKKGYDMALVFQGAGDNLVGLLYLSGAEAIHQMNTASTVRVGDKMEQGLQYVTEDVKFDDLVSGFLQGGQNAVLVTGPGGRVSGVITSRRLLSWISGN
jgi:Mg2+/Co2+ transporter CorB